MVVPIDDDQASWGQTGDRIVLPYVEHVAHMEVQYTGAWSGQSGPMLIFFGGGRGAAVVIVSASSVVSSAA